MEKYSCFFDEISTGVYDPVAQSDRYRKKRLYEPFNTQNVHTNF